MAYKLFKSSAQTISESEDKTPKELARIISLPTRLPINCEKKRGPGGKLIYSPATQALIEVMTERFALARTEPCNCEKNGHPCIKQLNAEQAWTLRELGRVGGVLGFIPIGKGKTACGILAPLAILGIRNAVLLAKSDQRLHYRKMWEKLKEHFVVPSFVLDDGGPLMIVGDGTGPVLHYVPYSKLSRPESTTLFNDLKPDLIIGDEIHALASNFSSRSMRFLRYASSRQGLKFCGWSGTLIDKSIRSVAHISAHALGYGSPFPINPNDVEAWASVIDPSPQPDRNSSTARAIISALGGVVKENRSIAEEICDTQTKRLREGFQKRLSETPGVITSKSTSSTASITVYERPLEVPKAVKDALESVRGWVRPDGEELVEITEQARTAKECGVGFYYVWLFGDEPRELIDKWRLIRKTFNRELRERILRGEEHMDSRFLCERAAIRAYMNPAYQGNLPTWRASNWPAWRDIKDTVHHTQGVKWIDDFLVKDAVAWGNEHVGIIWTLSRALGMKIAEVGNFNYHGGGPEAEKKILSEKGDKTIVASIRAHGEGRDLLQMRFYKQLLAEMPSGGKTLNQLLGRLCRLGQPQDEILTWTYQHFTEAKEALGKARRQAEFVDDMTDGESLLRACDFTFDTY